MTLSTKPRGRILVVRGGAIGDFILTLPVLKALRERFPKADLEVLGYPRIVELALHGGLADRVMAIEARGMAGFFARKGVLDSSLASYFGGFSLIISFLYDPDEIFQENVARCSDAQFIAGPYRPKEDEALHATEVFLTALQKLAVFDADPIPRLSFKSWELTALPVCKESANHGMRRWIAIHPGSGSERKNWPSSKWQELLTRIASETDLNVLLVGGEAEMDRLSLLSSLIPKERLWIARNRPLVEVAALLRQCHAYVGHDSGISHLAGAVELPGLLLWNDTNAVIWKPRSDRLRVLSSPNGLSQVSSEEVFSALLNLA